ncbi:tetratricopeptide repeat protein [Streptomyces sp. NBC_01262]|uniref:tetratricopeptide repeat protein n=1 Tax=Streptomyces sp. NBC_01262 TaxID=2903803 RepID=UPI002E335A0E|nr:tetratricopeptide repeat protein [Streptomyces sp. NBC_01262]
MTNEGDHTEVGTRATFNGQVIGKVEHHHGPVPIATSSLPPAPTGFTGRDADLDRLLPVLAPEAPDTEMAVVICAVSGLGGIGKTALALYAAHRADADGWFPGGMVFVDLRGYDPDPVTADQAVLALLDAFGVRGTDLPQTATAQYALYRTRLAQQPERMLLVLDNVSDPAQVAPLLPGTHRHRVLVTSRARLVDLDARLVDLDPLTPDAAIGLITRALHISDDRDDRPAREPDALRELAVLCGHIPLALQMVGAMLRRRRYRSIASLADEIRAAADPDDALRIRAVLDVTYDRLPEDQARVFRLFALAPTAEADTDAIAAMAELPAHQTLTFLESLATARVVTPVPTNDAGSMRWRLHDVVRAYATGLAEASGEAEAARDRVLGFYYQQTKAADDHLRWLPGLPVPSLFAGRVEALGWLDAERANLVAAAQWADDDRRARTAIPLALCLGMYLNWRRYSDDQITVCRCAQRAAARTGDQTHEAIAWTILGAALPEAGRAAEAIEAHARSRDLFQTTGDRNREAVAWDNLGSALREAGRAAEAIDAHIRSRDICQAIGDRNGEASAWNNLGSALREAGQVVEAIDAHIRSRDLFQATGDRSREAQVWNNLGNSLREASQVEESIDAYRAALELYAEFDNWYATGRTLRNLARAHQATGDPTSARTAWLQAADAYTRANAPTEADEARRSAQQ